MRRSKIKGQQDNGEQSNMALNGEHKGQPQDVGMAIFSEKAKAALEFSVKRQAFISRMGMFTST